MSRKTLALFSILKAWLVHTNSITLPSYKICSLFRSASDPNKISYNVLDICRSNTGTSIIESQNPWGYKRPPESPAPTICNSVTIAEHKSPPQVPVSSSFFGRPSCLTSWSPPPLSISSRSCRRDLVCDCTHLLSLCSLALLQLFLPHVKPLTQWNKISAWYLKSIKLLDKWE